MLRFYIVSSMLIALFYSASTAAKEGDKNTVFAHSKEVRAAIEKVIFNNYMGGQIIGDAEVIKAAFSPDSVMLSPNFSKKGHYSLNKWLDMHSEVTSWGAVPNKNIDINEVKILKLDVIDERLATAQIKMEDRVYEVVTLVKMEDVWKIASKVFIPQT